ncbi:NmrA/HSCARG family protein [Winogradskya consettensis]|uniref:NmrA family transcriptional regulator n=1 Tax=Winogradskya consettensis TaxID=113560 RepID=A0A919SZQ7_9ACTN|nr:NmrA/HSCARG family protein [Actinoplanes consettensis]GIM80984.1 NmrA family transcriptional regulator [Actinoplanes consettensis]
MSVLVIGATGKQGGSTARALLAQGTSVRALVRDPRAAAAQELAKLGAELAVGDLDDRATLLAAARGVDGVFSIPYPDVNDLAGDAEAIRGRNLVEAAREAGVTQFVHSSVSGAGEFHRTSPGWAEGRWDRHYWESKAGIDELVRTSGFARWTVLKPATFMENFIGFSYLFGDWAATGTIITGFSAGTRIPLIAVDDIGAAAATAFGGAGTLDGVDLEMAGDVHTMTEIAAILTEETGRKVEAPVLTSDEAVARGMLPFMVNAVERMDVVGSPAHPGLLTERGLQATDFRTWSRKFASNLSGPAGN